MARLTLILTTITAVIALLGGFHFLVNEYKLARARKRQTGKWLLSLAVCLIPSMAHADIETRATELGSAAKCAQSWNSTITSNAGDSYGYTQDDTPTKPCIVDGVQFIHLHNESPVPVSGTSGTYATVFSALPAAHTNTRVLVMPEGFTGQTEGGHTGGAQIRTQGRWAWRWYIYYSSNYSSYAFPAGPCTNSSKFATIQTSFLQMSHLTDLTTPLVYGWGAADSAPYNWLPDVSECCNEGPGYDHAAAADGALPGSWWRYEIIGHGMDGTTGAYLKGYRKNITINGPERTIIDTTVPCVDCGDNGFDWPSGAQTAFQSPTGMSFVTNNLYRAGTCSGYNAVAYELFAQWDTDDNQRIGAAVEMEGSGSPSTIVLFLEVAPVITSIVWHFRAALLSGVLAVWMMGGAFLSLTTQKTKQISYNAATATMQSVNKVLGKVTHKGGRHDA